jgi:hypothetical protein
MEDVEGYGEIYRGQAFWGEIGTWKVGAGRDAVGIRFGGFRVKRATW